jgi:photosystem II stability/assembly factor-like uncharacterized protein
MKRIYFLLFIYIVVGIGTINLVATIPTDANGQRFDDVFFLNANLWMGLYKDITLRFIKTTDGGTTWTEQISNGSFSYEYFRMLNFR